MPTVIVADSLTESRENIKTILRADPTIEVIGEARDGDEALQLVKSLSPDVLILDANIAGIDAIEVTERVSPNVGVIIISLHDDKILLRQLMRAGASDFLLKPVARDELIDAVRVAAMRVQRYRALAAGGSEGRVGQIIAVYSPKGGSGKTVIACNLAVALARHHTGPVCLVDLNLQYGNVDMVLNLMPQHTIASLAQRQGELELEVLERHLTTHEDSGLQVLVAPSTPQYAETVTVYLVEQVLSLLRKGFDYIIVDLPTVLEDYSMVALDTAEYIILVTELDVLAIHNTRVALEILRQLYSPERIKVVLNRANSQVQITPEKVEEVLGCTLLARIPSDGRLVVSSVNNGIPFVLSHPNAEISRSIVQLAYAIMGREAPIGELVQPTKQKRRIPVIGPLIDYLLGPS
ncbi:MAG: response regulator [Armatimonadota bacterium]|nr:response regulator [Armatimonadota bacterium]MCX7777688.1 response regulator [Armatimonadota bacterium]MDW8025447.1 response regulator [Armatimonadota bacterium]